MKTEAEKEMEELREKTNKDFKIRKIYEKGWKRC